MKIILHVIACLSLSGCVIFDAANATYVIATADYSGPASSVANCELSCTTGDTSVSVSLQGLDERGLVACFATPSSSSLTDDEFCAARIQSACAEAASRYVSAQENTDECKVLPASYCEYVPREDRSPCETTVWSSR